MGLGVYKMWRKEKAKIVPASVLLIVYIEILMQTAFFSREPGSRKQIDLNLFGTWGETPVAHAYFIENIDATVIAQKPKLRPYIAQMEENIAKTLGIAKEQINIKATTEEGLGFTGTEEGISSQAICMLNGFYESSMVVGGGSKCAGCPGCSRS